MKTLLKKLLIPPFASRLVSRVATRIFGRGIPIFLLHRITSETTNNSISADHLRRCLQYLVDNGYTFISLKTLVQAITEETPLPEKSVVFTMDDGFLDQAKIAVPIFLEFNCPLTFFVISDLLNQNLWPWDAQTSWIINNTRKNKITIDFPDETLHLEINEDNRHEARELIRNYFKEVEATQIPLLLAQLAKAAELDLPQKAPQQYQALDWQQARDLEKQGICFAPHSISHRILSKLDSETAEKEILGSWQQLQNELVNPLNVFCYPTGRILDFGPREIDILKNHGFAGAVSTIPGYIVPDNNPTKRLYSMPRFELPSNMTDFIQYCSWIEHAKHAE